MKRTGVTSSLLMFLLLVAWPLSAMDSGLLSIFYVLWKESGFGKDPDSTERAAWIYRREDTQFAFVRWPRSGERSREFWHGPVPGMAVALAHTHADRSDPRPSLIDIGASRRIGIPVYVISCHGIWVATPNGTIWCTQGPDWYRMLK